MQITRELLEKVLYSTPPHCPNEGKELWIWGAGNTSCLYQEGLKRIPEINNKISGYCDTDISKQGKSVFYGKDVISPQELKSKKDAFVLICSANVDTINDISILLTDMGIKSCLIDYYIFITFRDKIMQVYDVLNDAESKNVYANIILDRMFGMNPTSDIVKSNDFFTVKEINPALRLSRIIDCGAYVGDTFEQYIWNNDGVFEQYIGFEPDAANYAAFQKRIGRLNMEWNIPKHKVRIYPYAVGEKSEWAKHNNNENVGPSTSLKVLDDDVDILGATKIVAIDEVVNESYDFLKADIESFEYGMLLGAVTGIIKYKPALAICIYHNAIDMFQIPLLVKQILPEYKIAVRHHRNDLSETVMYAWV